MEDRGRMKITGGDRKRREIRKIEKETLEKGNRKFDPIN